MKQSPDWRRRLEEFVGSRVELFRSSYPPGLDRQETAVPSRHLPSTFEEIDALLSSAQHPDTLMYMHHADHCPACERQLKDWLEHRLDEA